MNSFLALILMIGAYVHAGDVWPPVTDAEWNASTCRFRSTKPEGAYGNVPSGTSVPTLARCVVRAQASLIHLEQTVFDIQEPSFHDPAVVEFIDPRGERHECMLYPRPEAFDVLPVDVLLRMILESTGPKPLSSAERQMLDRNIAVECSTPVG